MNNDDSLLIIPAVSFVLVVNHLNPAIKEFFTDAFVMFVILSLLYYRFSRNIAVSMAEAFVTVLAIQLVILQDPVHKVKETFKLIFPTPDSKLTCNDMTASSLLSRYDNDRSALESDMLKYGVPGNIQVNDENAPVIATYLNLC